jgi:hypothetical protein
VSDHVNANGMAEEVPSGYARNALQSVTRSDLAMHADGSNGCYGSGKGRVIVTAPAHGALLRRHLKEGYQKINRAIGIDDYRFTPYRKDH